jgi:ABC-type transporter Mla maintaining outer membrane lipid asymmetry permease subunit MlaE
MSQSIAEDTKEIFVHEETKNTEAVKHIESYQLKSEFDTLSVPQILWKFRKSISFAIFIGITALAEGYAVIINGWVLLNMHNGLPFSVIIANPGFVEQFGTVTTPAGGKALAPSIVSAWGAVQAAAQIVTSFSFST